MFFCEIQFRPNPYFIEPKLFFSNQLCFWQFHAKDIVTDMLVKLLAVVVYLCIIFVSMHSIFEMTEQVLKVLGKLDERNTRV